MQERWRIQLFGGLRVEHRGRVITRFQTQKSGVLLAYLAYYRHRAHPREVLIELLWPECEPRAGRHRVSQALSSLRHQLEPPGIPAGAVLIADRVAVQLNAAAVIIDVAECEAALQRAERAGRSSERAQFLADAVALYRGRLLPAYHDNWILVEQERLAERYFQALRELVGLMEQAGDLPRALDFARRAVGADPHREEAHTELIRLLAAAGQHSLAVRQYQELARILKEVLDIEPSAATRELAKQLSARSGPVALEKVPVPSAPRHLNPSTPQHAAAHTQPPTPIPTGTVTFLLAEIAACEEHGGPVEEVSRGAPASPDALLSQGFRQHGGTVVREEGGSFAVVFGRASDALACALAVQRAMASQPSAVTGQSSQAGGGTLRVRIALDTVEVSWPARMVEEEASVTSAALHRAEQVLLASHAGQTVCSAATAILVQRDLEPSTRLVDLGVYRLRGAGSAAAERERLFQVEYTGMVPRQFPRLNAEAGIAGNLPLQFTRFFGREAEMARLQVMLLGPGTGTNHGGTETRREGREEEGKRGGGENAGSRFITLTGPGGSGKTRLALAVAGRLVEELQGAVWFVPLADLSPPTPPDDGGAGTRLRIVDAVLQALRLPRTPGIEPVDQVVEALSRRPALLVLDNFEHLAVEGAPLVVTLLERLPALTCLVTSRQRLNVSGEREFSLGPLPTPVEGQGSRVKGLGLTPSQPQPSTLDPRPSTLDPQPSTLAGLMQFPSVQLFVDRAQGVRADFQVTKANASAVAELCRRLEGIPLALELAAARAQVLTPAQMLAHLEDRFDFLVGRQRGAAARHRTLRAAMKWSYRLLAPELQRFFARLSVFRGGWTLEAAEAVCGAPMTNVQCPMSNEDPAAEHWTLVIGHWAFAGTALDYLAQLRECSLVVADDQGAGMRFRMLETLREYAREQLTADERARLERRHAGYYLALAEEVAAHFEDGEFVEWSERPEALDALDPEQDNLRAALAWALAHDPEWGLRLAGALGPFWESRSYWTEGCTAMRQALERGAGAPVELQTKVLGWAGLLELVQGACEHARELLTKRLEMCRNCGDRRGIAKSLSSLGWVADIQYDSVLARGYYEESAEIRRENGDKRGVAWSLNSLAHLQHVEGDNAAALALYEASLALFREIGNKRGIAWSLNDLGRVAYAQQEYEAARTYHEESLAVCRETGNRWESAMTLTLLGHVAQARGEPVVARAYHQESLELFREAGDRKRIAMGLSDLGDVAQALGEPAAARRYYEESLGAAQEIGHRWCIAQSLSLLGGLARVRGDHAAARAMYEEGLRIRREIGNPWWISESLADMGSAALAQGDCAAAGAYWRESLAIVRESDDRPRLSWAERHIARALEGVAHIAAVEAGDAAPAGAPSPRRARTRREQAVRLYSAAHALRESIAASLPPNEQCDRGEKLAGLREALGEAAFTAAWTAGRALSWTQAAACALKVTRQQRAAAAVGSSHAQSARVKSARNERARPARRPPYPTDLTDAQWRRIEPLIPRARPGGRPREVDLRAVIDAILYKRGAACGWRRLPHGFPPWATVHDYYRRWRRDGTWQQIGQALDLPGTPGE